MIESDYWVSLASQLCRKFAAMPEVTLRYLWCNGLVPEQYLLDSEPPTIKGLAWISDGNRQEQWGFTLFLSQRVGPPHEIDWASLLPTNLDSGWLTVDASGKHIRIEPGIAAPPSDQHA